MMRDILRAAGALLVCAALPALAQPATKSPPYPTVGGYAAQPVVPMVWDASISAFVPQGSGFVAQTFAGTGSLQIAAAGIGTVTVQASGSGGGLAFLFQGSNDGGTTWQTLPGFVPASGVAATSFSANGVWQANPAGFTLFRINLTAISSGTETFTVTTSTAQSVFNGANVAVTASVANGTQVKILDSGGSNVAGVTTAGEVKVDCTTGCNGSNGSVSATGAAVPGAATYLGGSNGGNLQGVAVNGSGQVAIQAPPSLPALAAGTNSIGTVQIGNTPNTTPILASLNDGSNTAKVEAASTTPAAADKALTVSLSPNALGCAGQSLTNTNVKPVNITATTRIITGTASKKTYICAIDLVVSAADNVALLEGTQTSTACDTSATGMAGGATAATGWNFAANGGIAKGNGQGILYLTATAADDVCLFVSASAQVSGSVVWVQF